MADELKRAIAQAFALRPDDAHNMRRRCPYCQQLGEPKDFLSSFREQPDGTFLTVQLCRTCRDSGL